MTKKELEDKVALLEERIKTLEARPQYVPMPYPVPQTSPPYRPAPWPNLWQRP